MKSKHSANRIKSNAKKECKKERQAKKAVEVEAYNFDSN